MMNSHEPQNTALYLLGLVKWNSWAASKVAPVESVVSLEAIRQLQASTIELLSQLRIECVRVNDIVAWYKVIDRSEFEGQDAVTNLADLNWLTPRVLAHEAVVSKLCEYFVTYPARFGCLFSSQERLIDFVQENTAILQCYFQTVGHKQEWGIKITANVDEASESLARQQLGTDQSTGNRYLKLKQLTRQLRPQALEQLRASSQRLLTELKRVYPQLVVRTLSLGASPDRQHVLASVALLLDAQESQSMQQWCHEQAEQTDDALPVQLNISGPWPPYSFCPSLDANGGQAAYASGL